MACGSTVSIPGLSPLIWACNWPTTLSPQASHRTSAPPSPRSSSGRLGEVGDMADAAVFLCSNEARFITGAGLPVDGGMGM